MPLVLREMDLTAKRDAIDPVDTVRAISVQGDVDGRTTASGISQLRGTPHSAITGVKPRAQTRVVIGV